jgi:GTP-binding protein
MLPVIALVGRPNVGKSTLFNRLTRTRDALVADQPGLTRDRKYGFGKLGDRPYLLVDTGGLSGASEGVEALMEQQVARAIDEADYLLFLVDAKAGCTADDETIAMRLRRTGKPVKAVVNKIDGHDPDIASSDFHRLGLGEPAAIAAAHGRGVSALIHEVLAGFPETEPSSDSEHKANEQRTSVAVVGRPNVGKSTLINRLLGEERVVAFDQPGTTRDSQFIPFSHHGRDYTLIDTAGVRRRGKIFEAVEKFSVIKTLQAIEQANAIILVVDAQQGLSEQDSHLAGHVLESGRALVVAINKWDGLQQEERQRIRDEMQRRIAFLDFASWHFVSALHGSGVGLLLDAVDKAYANATRKLSTPELNRILQQLVSEHQPPLVHGHRIKLRYAHQGGRNPPIIVIHGNQTEALPATYRRFLSNRYRQALKLDGTPLHIEFKTADNPFEGRKNTLTDRQVRKRQRLKTFTKKKT